MSTSTYEYGTIKFSAQGYTSVSKDFRERINTFNEFLYEFASYFYSQICSQKSMTYSSGIDRATSIFFDRKDKAFNNKPNFVGYSLNEESIARVVSEVLRGKVVSENKSGICKPRKSSFKKLSSRDHSFSVDIFLGRIEFKKDLKSIIWNVHENNNSVEHAHNDCLAKQLFKILGAYKWKGKEGGNIYGWDANVAYEEGCEDEDYCGDGSEHEYVSMTFGAKK